MVVKKMPSWGGPTLKKVQIDKPGYSSDNLTCLNITKGSFFDHSALILCYGWPG